MQALCTSEDAIEIHVMLIRLKLISQARFVQNDAEIVL